MRRVVVFIAFFSFTFSLFSQSDSQLIDAKIAKVNDLLFQGKVEEGLAVSRDGLAFALSVKDSSAVVEFHYLQSRLFRDVDRIDSAMNSLVKGSVYATNGEDKVKINYQIGEILLEIGSYQLSIPYLEDMVKNEEDLKAKFYHYNLLGKAYLKSQNKAESIHNFENQLEIAKQLKNEHLIINAYNNLGLIYVSIGVYDQAKFYLTKVVEELTKQDSVTANDREILLNANFSLSKAYFEEGDYENTIHAYHAFETIAEETKQEIPVYESYFISLLELNKLKEASAYLTQFKGKLEDDKSKAVLSRLKIIYYSKTNQNKALQEELKKYEVLRVKAEVQNEKVNQHKLDLIGKFYISLAENNLSYEEAKYLKLAAEKRNADLLLWTSLGGSIFLVLVLIYFFMEKQKRNKIKNKLLLVEKENLDISLQLKKQDLSKASLDLSQRSEVLNEFLSKFRKIESVKAEEVKERVVEEIRKLKQFNASRSTLDQFLAHTDVINAEFYKNLESSFPNLTKNETDLCAFLVLNLTTKDIANLQGILPSSVRINKMRLKKKLNIQEGSLEDYLKNMIH